MRWEKSQTGHQAEFVCVCVCVCMSEEGPQCLQGLERPPSDPSALSPFPFSSGPVGRNPTRWSKITLSERRFRPNGRFGGLGTIRGESKSASKMASNPIPNFIRGSWLNPSHPCPHLDTDSSESVETLVVFRSLCGVTTETEMCKCPLGRAIKALMSPVPYSVQSRPQGAVGMM